jgi:AmmeMemoRadiSam system protein A
MIEPTLSPEDRHLLLRLARDAITLAASGARSLPPRPEQFPPRLQEPGATFVTLTTMDGDLRGCIGALEAYQSIAEDVWEHAEAAATQDYRFQPVRPEEVDGLHIEISYLTPAVPLEYSGPDDLVAKLRPEIDGVIIRDGIHRATFLPQVWEKVPDAAAFLSHLCQKMGAPGDLWRRKRLEVLVYQVECFEEE